MTISNPLRLLYYFRTPDSKPLKLFKNQVFGARDYTSQSGRSAHFAIRSF